MEVDQGEFARKVRSSNQPLWHYIDSRNDAFKLLNYAATEVLSEAKTGKLIEALQGVLKPVGHARRSGLVIDERALEATTGVGISTPEHRKETFLLLYVSVEIGSIMVRVGSRSVCDDKVISKNDGEFHEVSGGAANDFLVSNVANMASKLAQFVTERRQPAAAAPVLTSRNSGT